MLIRKNKKGIELAFGGIISIIVILVAGGVLLWAFLATAPKIEGKSPVELCASTNRIKVGIEHKTSEYVSPPNACQTIEQTSGKSQVPTRDYDQNEAGAAEEVRDMIMKCWYMWLDGSEPNMFRLFPGEKTCQVCYRFRIKDSVGSLNLEKLIDSMNELYFVSIPNKHNCDTYYGGEWVDGEECPLDLIATKSIILPDGKKQVCCRKDVRFECENKGGICCENKEERKCSTVTGESIGVYEQLYDKWACPITEEKCYVKAETGVYYMEYLTESSLLGGELMILDPDQNEGSGTPIKNINYGKDKIWAISFVSPAKQYCGSILCKYQWFSDKTNVWSYFLRFVGSVGGPIRTFVRHISEDVRGLVDVKNSIMLSSFEEARKLGCAVE